MQGIFLPGRVGDFNPFNFDTTDLNITHTVAVVDGPWPAATASYSLPPLPPSSRTGETRKNESKQTHGLRLRQFNSWKKEGGNISYTHHVL